MGPTNVVIAAMGGSLRRDSLNRHLLNAAIAIGNEMCEMVRLDVGEIPLYDQDLDPGWGGENPPDTVARFAAAVERSDGILLVSPEYNWGVPGYLKNAVDWISHPPFDSVMVGRPTLLMGASVGPAGTGRAQLAWRQTLLSIRTPVLIDSLQLAFAHTRIDRSGAVDDVLEAEITLLIELLVDEARAARERGLPESLRRSVPGPVPGMYPRPSQQ